MYVPLGSSNLIVADVLLRVIGDPGTGPVTVTDQLVCAANPCSLKVIAPALSLNLIALFTVTLPTDRPPWAGAAS